MTPESDETHKLIHVALEVLKLGDRDTAQQLAQQAAALSPGLEAPWLILAALASPEESLKYIHKALQINPHSQPAQSALNWALKRQPPFAVSPRPVPLQGPLPQEINSQPEPLQTSTPQTIEPEPEPSRAEIAVGIPPESEPAWEETAREIPSELETRREEIPQEIPLEPQSSQAEVAGVIPTEPEPAWEETTRAIPLERETYWDKPEEDIPPESSQAEFAQAIPLEPKPAPEPISPVIEPELAVLGEEIAQPIPPQTEPARGRSTHLIRPAGPTASPKSTARPSVPARETKKFSLSPGLFALFTFIGLVVIVLLVGFYFFQPQISGQLARLLNPIPPPQCVQPLLKIGSVQFPIKSIARAADGSLPAPDRADIAWWVQDTTVNYVFEVNPVSVGAAALAKIQIDDSLTIVWADCTTDSYVANTIATEAPLDPSVFDQTNAGISIFVPGSATTAQLLIRGVRP